MKRTTLAAIAAIAALAVFAALPAAAGTPVDAEAALEVPAADLPTAEQQPLLTEPVAAPPGQGESCTLEAQEMGGIIPPPDWCPYGAPRCFEDDHCDAYCGDPRFGACLSNNCCGCYG